MTWGLRTPRASLAWAALLLAIFVPLATYALPWLVYLMYKY